MKTKKVYICSKCHSEFSKWSGMCDECGEWNTLEEGVAPVKSAKSSNSLSKSSALPGKYVQLKTVSLTDTERIVTQSGEFNRVMGGGIVPDSLTIITGPPGGGKSTLSLMVANDVANMGKRVLYASGEESQSQIKNRANRVTNNISDNLWILSDESMDKVVAAVYELDPELIIIDSIQTFSLQEYFPARSGNPVQTMECANELLRMAKGSDKNRAVIIIGQMNKSEQIAGLRALEHLVDTVLVIDGENQEELRTVQATKNRFGSTGEMGFFTMCEEGMVSVDNPSQFFITKRKENEFVTGSALTVVREGSRPIILEVESLVSNSYTPYPARTTESMNRDQLNTLISILEQRGKVNLYNKNVVVKATGGLKLKEQSSNLAVVMSILSSLKEIPLPNDVVFIGDVGLTGEIKKVPATENRIREIARMGFKKVYIPRFTFNKKPTFKDIEVIEIAKITDVINLVK